MGKYLQKRITEDAALADTQVKVEVVVKSSDLERCVDAIVKAAHTGKIGDGKIFVTSVERVVRIRTGEQDESAV